MISIGKNQKSSSVILGVSVIKIAKSFDFNCLDDSVLNIAVTLELQFYKFQSFVSRVHFSFPEKTENCYIQIVLGTAVPANFGSLHGCT